MSQCPVCHAGELRRERVETWMRRADQWVLFTGVPAMRCDTCGETTFSQGTAARLSDLLAPDAPEQPTGSRVVPEYDVEELDRRRETERTSPGVGTRRLLA